MLKEIATSYKRLRFKKKSHKIRVRDTVGTRKLLLDAHSKN